MSDMLPSLWLSLRVASVATLAALVVAIPLAFAMARLRFRGKSLIEGFLLTPLVLPPTVVGYLIIILLGARGWVGRWLSDWFEYSILFQFEGAVLAAMVVAMPLIYMPARSAFASVDRELEDIARLLGAGRVAMFWHISLPMARRGVVSGMLLGFARALGEFGATVMVFGWQPGRQTLPISIYAHFEQGDLGAAAPAVIALSVLSLTLVLAHNASSLGRRD